MSSNCTYLSPDTDQTPPRILFSANKNIPLYCSVCKFTPVNFFHTAI